MQSFIATLIVSLVHPANGQLNDRQGRKSAEKYNAKSFFIPLALQGSLIMIPPFFHNIFKTTRPDFDHTVD